MKILAPWRQSRVPYMCCNRETCGCDRLTKALQVRWRGICGRTGTCSAARSSSSTSRGSCCSSSASASARTRPLTTPATLVRRRVTPHTQPLPVVLLMTCSDRCARERRRPHSWFAARLRARTQVPGRPGAGHTRRLHECPRRRVLNAICGTLDCYWRPCCTPSWQRLTTA